MPLSASFPVFPIPLVDGGYDHGLLVRDYIAIEMMKALVAHHGLHPTDVTPFGGVGSAADDLATAAVQYADALLRAL